MKKIFIWKENKPAKEQTSRIVNTDAAKTLYNGDMECGETMKKDNIIGQNIRKLRIRYGDTQKQLGDALGYGPTTIANYESGYRQPDIQTAKAIAARYGVTLDDLMSSEL